MTSTHCGNFRSQMTRNARAAMLAFSLVLGFTNAAVAENIQWREGVFDLQAVNEPLNVFLTRLLTLQGIATTISSNVSTGRVNGRFKGKASAVFREVVDTYGLTWFYDGTTLEICSLSEVETRLLEVDPGDVARLERNLRQFRLSDARFPLRISTADGQIMVSGPPRFVDMVVSVADKVSQSPTKPKVGVDVRVFRLKHARAVDTTVSIGGVDTVITGLARVLNDIVGEMKYEPVPTARSTPRTLPGLRGKGLASIGRNDAGTGGAGNRPAGAGSMGFNSAGGDLANQQIMPMIATGGGDPAPQRPAADAQPTGRTASVRAEARINAVIVRDAPERMAMYARLIESLDIDVPLIEIEASVIDVSDDKSEQLGIDWRAHGNRFDVSSSPNGLAGTGVQPTNLANDLVRSANPISAGAGLVGTLIFGSDRSYFLARLNALADKGDARTVSKPRVLTIDNTEAVLQSTSEFFVRVAGERQVDLFNVSLGLTMRVTPTLVEDNQGRRIKMIVRIEDGNTNAGRLVDQIPVVNRNSISTQAVVGDGQSLLIGGYVIEENSGGKNGVPGLSDVPVLGWLFGQKTSKVRRVERMFMLTPRVVTLSDLSKTPTSAPAVAPTSINAPGQSVAPTSNAVPAPRPPQVLSLATRR
jgi:type III secretion protein C